MFLHPDYVYSVHTGDIACPPGVIQGMVKEVDIIRTAMLASSARTGAAGDGASEAEVTRCGTCHVPPWCRR